MRRRRRGDDGRAESLRDCGGNDIVLAPLPTLYLSLSYILREKGKLTLHGREANATGGGMDEDVVAFADLGPHHQRSVARGRRDVQAGGLLEGPAVGHGEERELGALDPLREGTLRGAEDARADGVLGLPRARRRGDDCARELEAGRPREC